MNYKGADTKIRDWDTTMEDFSQPRPARPEGSTEEEWHNLLLMIELDLIGPDGGLPRRIHDQFWRPEQEIKPKAKEFDEAHARQERYAAEAKLYRQVRKLLADAKRANKVLAIKKRSNAG